MSLTVDRLYAMALDAPAEADVVRVAGARSAMCSAPDWTGPEITASGVAGQLPATDAVDPPRVYTEQTSSESQGTATDPLADADDNADPARGFVIGALLAVPLWGVIGLLIRSFLE